MASSFSQGFRRSNMRGQVEQRSLYLHSVCAFLFLIWRNVKGVSLRCLLFLDQVLTHRSGSASMLSLIYSEVLKMLRLWGMLKFDAEVYFPRDSHSPPTGYHKLKSKEAHQSNLMTSQSLLVEVSHLPSTVTRTFCILVTDLFFVNI